MQADCPALPPGWRMAPLEQVACVRTGLALSRHTPPAAQEVPYIRVANVQDGYLDLQDIKHMRLDPRQIARYALAVGDVLLTEGGNFDMLGRGDVWQGQIAPCVHQNHVFVVKTERSQLLPHFLSALTASSHGRRFFLRYGKRSTSLASISISQLRQFPVLLPPMAQQQVMVDALQCWDAALQTSDELIANSRQQQANLQHFLLRPRSDQGWRQVRLGDAVRIDAESLVRSKWPPQEPIRYLRIEHLKQGDIWRAPDLHSLADAPARARRVVHAGDVLLSLVRPDLQGLARALPEHEGCIASSGMAVLTPGAQISTDFLYHSLFGAALQQQIASLVAGSSYPQLSSKQLHDLQIWLPPPPAQTEISASLNQAAHRLQLEHAARAALLQQKMELIERFIAGALPFQRTEI
ncbi:restriction endonuclease subunit S [Massilia sp. W12]|uniref:restriction endonuclease subunit S n=1 Tax=Massilia sp. W12 TaxID=3126507 RepID=UPI0030D41DDA